MNVDRPAPTPPPAQPSAAAPRAPLPGLAGLRAHLDRVVRRHRLRSLVVVVDDPDLGRQAFRAGSGAVEAGVVASGPGVTTDPPLAPGDLDEDMLTALCAMSLHLQLLGEVDEPDDDGELALRRLPGVYAVALERDGDVTLCHVLATADAPEDVARRAAEALTASSGAKVVVEVLRDPAGPGGRAAPGVDESRSTRPHAIVEAGRRATPVLSETIAERFADATWSADALASRPTSAQGVRRSPGPVPVPQELPARSEPPILSPTLLAVRSVPEDGEIEVHLAIGGTRTVGRAPLSRGLAGATEAVLVGASQLDPTYEGWIPAWVRTVETTADGHFVVAASLSGPTGEHHHGIAPGTSPIEGAARATALAIAEGLRTGEGASGPP